LLAWQVLGQAAIQQAGVGSRCRELAGRPIQIAVNLGSIAQFAGTVLSNAGQPRLLLRPMVALGYLKLVFNLGDEELLRPE
jgi:hypothetical protein